MKRLFTLLTLLGVFLLVQAQDRNITGKVTDANTGESVPGVSIVLEGTTRGAVTDLDGNFSIEASDGQVLLFSFVGYLTETIALQGQTSIDVALVPDLQAIEEIVVVGYGTQKKSLVTGAIAKVGAEEIAQTRSTRVESALQGKTAGVLVQQTSGAPGAEQNIIIRGVGSDNNVRPLYVIDGIRTDGIDWLDPEDIESLEVLKDAASAAIYGTEGANGVIIITTKSGKDKGGKSTLTYDGSYGWQEAIPNFKVMNTTQYQDWYRYAWMLDGNNRTYEQAVARIPTDSINDTDWLGEVFTMAPVQKHKIGLSGGTEKSQYYLSLSYTDQEGIIGGGDKSRFTRYAFKLNLDSEATNWLKMGTRLSYSYTEKRGISQNGVFGTVTNSAIVLDPTTPAYYADTNGYYPEDLNNMREVWGNTWYLNPGIQDENGYFGISQNVQNEISNPVMQLANDRDKEQINKIIGGIYGEIKFWDDLQFRTTVDIDLSHNYVRGWNPRAYTNAINAPDSLSAAYQNINLYYTWQWEGYFTYNKTIQDHTIGAVLGGSAREFEQEYLGARSEELIEETDNYAWVNYGTYIDTTQDNPERGRGSLANWQTQHSIFGRVNYSYKDKYMATINFRRDGDSRFGPNNKYGVFPSFSVGWVVSRENFWNVQAMNFLKPRYSFGITGNAQSLGWDWRYIPQTSYGEFYYPDANNGLQFVREPQALVNPNYAWEEVQQHNFGVDMGFLQNKITFTFEWYEKKHTKEENGFLMDGSTAAALGNEPPVVNAGIIRNRGVEFDVNYKDNLGEVFLSVQLTASQNKAEVLSMTQGIILEGGNLGTFGNSKRFEVGYEPWYFYGFESDGIFTSQAQIDAHVNAAGELLQPNAKPGDVKYLDIAGASDADGADGVIDDNDRTHLGSPYPKWITGLNVTVEYKGFDLNLYTYASIGNKTLNATSIRTDLPNTNRPDYYFTDAWLGEDQQGDFPRPTVSDRNRNFSRLNEFLLQDGSFLRISNLTLGYTLPKSLSEKASITKLRVYGAVDNLYTFTKYQGMEVEVGGDYYGYRGQQWTGIDRGVYPRPRIFSVGFNVTF